MNHHVKTAKELAEETAELALTSLRSALEAERVARECLRTTMRHSIVAMSTAEVDALKKVRAAEERSDAAFAAWRSAQIAVEP